MRSGRALGLSAAAAAALAGVPLLNALRPGTRLWPDALKHRWSLGAFGIGSIYALFVAPFALTRERRVAVAGAAVATGLLAGPARVFAEWVTEDVSEHLADRRSPFVHDERCQVGH